MPQISGTEQDIFAYRTLGAFKNTRHKNRKASVLTLASQGWVEAFSFPRSLSSPQQVNTRFLSTLIQIVNGGLKQVALALAGNHSGLPQQSLDRTKAIIRIPVVGCKRGRLCRRVRGVLQSDLAAVHNTEHRRLAGA